MKLPKLSIITVNLNNKAGLQKTIESVFSQTFTDYEYLVIDGGSEDGSKELIKKYENKFVYCVSEKDKGIYDAMNKGILRADGEYVLFLNSGDYLIDKEVLDKVFQRQLKQDIIFGDIIWDTNGKHKKAKFPDQLSFEFLTTNSLAHQGTFFKKELFDKTGLYDEEYPIVADWVLFLLAVYKYNCSYLHVEELISVCTRDGISCAPENWPKIVEDRKKATRQNFAAFEKDFDHFYSLRDELEKLQNELQLAKLTFGYRVQKKIERILKNSNNK